MRQPAAITRSSQFTIGILGPGVLGSRIGQALRHFDFPVLGWTRGLLNRETLLQLPPQHPHWHEPRITITPHISAKTVRAESIRQVAHKIAALERGESVTGLVDRNKGY